jgi:hypothetical protein
MARVSIYIPEFLHRRLRSSLPVEDNVSEVARASLIAKVHQLDGCDHEGHPHLCAHCHAPVDADAGVKLTLAD